MNPDVLKFVVGMISLVLFMSGFAWYLVKLEQKAKKNGKNKTG